MPISIAKSNFSKTHYEQFKIVFDALLRFGFGKVAVANPINRGLRTPKEIVVFFGIEESVISNWFKGEGLPSDHLFTRAVAPPWLRP